MSNPFFVHYKNPVAAKCHLSKFFVVVDDTGNAPTYQVNGIFTVSGIQAFRRQKNADGTSLSYLHMVFIDFKVPDNCHLFSESALFC